MSNEEVVEMTPNEALDAARVAFGPLAVIGYTNRGEHFAHDGSKELTRAAMVCGTQFFYPIGGFRGCGKSWKEALENAKFNAELDVYAR